MLNNIKILKQKTRTLLQNLHQNKNWISFSSKYLHLNNYYKKLNLPHSDHPSMYQQQSASHQIQKASDKDVEQVFTYSQFINTVKIINNGEDDFKLLKPLNLQLLQNNNTPNNNPNTNNSNININPNIPIGSSMLQAEFWKQNITPYHFRQLAIQFFYLLYSCSHKRIVPVPQDNQKLLCYSFQTNQVILCLTKFVTYQTSTLKDYQTNTPYFQFYKNFIKAIHPYWKQSQQLSTQHTKRQTLSSNYFINQLEQLIESKQFNYEKQPFNIFQHNQIFIQTSILLRIRNSSLICIIRQSQELIEHYKKFRTVENQLSEEYNDRRKRKNNIEKILQTERMIEKNIEEFFQGFNNIKEGNPKFYKVEDKRKKEMASSGIMMVNKILIGLKVYQLIDMMGSNKQPNESKMKQGNSQIMEIQTKKYDQDYYNLYQIQYCSSKNIIIVRMITDLILDWATSDSILFKWNTLTFQTSNVGLQTVEKFDETKKSKKFVVIRGTSYFNKKEPVLEKILTLIDITMATYKAIQLEMKSQNMFAKNLGKIDEAYKKINHYLKAIHKCCVKSYSAMMCDE